jgi:phospholipid N-methyltransferase
MEALKFLAAFLRDPTTIGAVAPSSRWLAARMVEGMELDGARLAVELGPGTGAFTGAILDRLGPQARYLALELNPEFATRISRLAARRPGARVINDSAERLSDHVAALGEAHADSVISGLPWANFPESLQRAILDAVERSLRPGGRFATFAYIHAMWVPKARHFRRLLGTYFRDVQTTPIVWRNLPPAFVYRCTK